VVKDLVVAGLDADLGGRRIVTDASLSVGAGELVGLIGANSVGKSTLLKAIAGLIPVARGTVTWRGKSLSDMTASERARTLAYMPQGQTFHWDVSVRHIVALGRLPHLGPLSRLSAHDSQAVEDAMSRADVAHLAERSAMRLSGGERSRVLLARALAIGAPMLMADEPTAALDPYHQLHTMELLRGLSREGRAVLAVLHDLSLAARFCDRVIILNQGRILADGPPRETLTAEFLGAAYRIEAFHMSTEDGAIVLPWRRLSEERITVD